MFYSYSYVDYPCLSCSLIVLYRIQRCNPDSPTSGFFTPRNKSNECQCSRWFQRYYCYHLYCRYCQECSWSHIVNSSELSYFYFWQCLTYAFLYIILLSEASGRFIFSLEKQKGRRRFSCILNARGISAK